MVFHLDSLATLLPPVLRLHKFSVIIVLVGGPHI